MIQFVGLDTEVTDNIPETDTTRKLPETECNELRSTRYFAQLAALMVLFGQGVEFMSRNKF